jgi:hypothetical protein
MSIKGQKKEKKIKDIKEEKKYIYGGFNLPLHPSSLVYKQVAF